MSSRAIALEEVLRRRLIGWTVASLLGAALGCWALAILSDAFIAPLRGGVATSLVTAFLPTVLFGVPLVLAMWAFQRLMAPPPPDPVFAWLRRFHLTGRGRTPFHRLLDEAAFGLGIPGPRRCVPGRSTRVARGLRGEYQGPIVLTND